MLKFKRNPTSNLPKKRRLNSGKDDERTSRRKKAARKEQEDETPDDGGPSSLFSELMATFKDKPDEDEALSSEDEKVGRKPTVTIAKKNKKKQVEEKVADNEDEPISEPVDVTDPYITHFVVNESSSSDSSKKTSHLKEERVIIKTKKLGDVTFKRGRNPLLPPSPSIELDKMHIKEQLLNNLKLQPEFNRETMEMMSFLTKYHDVLCMNRQPDSGNRWIFSYCTHIINHLLKVRQNVLNNNIRLEKMNPKEKIEAEARDQGFNRCRVLIVVPFRESAKNLVLMLTRILFGNKETGIRTLGLKRFMEEFDSESQTDEPNNKKPQDYIETFKGNTDDSFKIGMAITKKTLKLYTDFYESDIIITSTLAMRMLIKGEDKATNPDYLSSIEILVIDQVDILLMQNWEHMIEIMKQLNRQPKDISRIDFSRVKPYLLDGMGKNVRQSILISSTGLNELISLSNRYCCNNDGQLVINPTICQSMASISKVFLEVNHTFTRMDCDSITSCPDDRFNHFTQNVLIPMRDESNVLVYVSSYFDFVRIRNYMKDNEFSFVALCEYTDDGKIAQGRSKFFHKSRRILLLSERLHFYRRFGMKGVKKVIFYQAPTLPIFYSQIVNLMAPDYQGSKYVAPEDPTKKQMATSLTLFCKYDLHRLTGILGTESSQKLVMSRVKKQFTFESS